MSNDLQRFLCAVRTLEKLLGEYGCDAWLEALGRFATEKQENVVGAVGTILIEISDELAMRRVHRYCPCGEPITAGLGRADTIYCSAGCRQAAYRERVAAKDTKPKRKRNVERPSLRMERKKKQRAVTLLKCQMEAVAAAIGIDPSVIDDARDPPEPPS